MKKYLMSCNCADGWGEYGMLALRVALGAIFLMHGWQKHSEYGIDGVTGMLAGMNFPMAELFAYILTYGEIAAGIALIVGAFTHWAAKFALIVSVVAFFGVHLSKGFFISDGGYEFILLIFAASLVIMTRGGGEYSVDHMYLKKILK